MLVVGLGGFALRRLLLRLARDGLAAQPVTVPPAASIFSRADFEKPCAETESFFVSSPTPRIFTSTESLRSARFAFSASGVTSSPAAKRSSSARG